MDEPIYVTRPFLPPLEDFQPYLEDIWSSHQLTNGGPYHQHLENALQDKLGVDHLSLFANGTLALITALQALDIRGEVITTPYSFVATTHALKWNQIQPVFVDVEAGSLNLDPARIEAAITPDTTAILATHVYGHPCAVKEIQRIADLYGLKVIYDAAHAFGVEDEDGSILRHGDMSIQSYHATKIFTTFEGGSIVSPDSKTKARIDYLKNFGFADEETVVKCGINGKMNELQAAVGLAALPHLDSVLEKRAKVDRAYREALEGIEGIRLHDIDSLYRYNYAYFPIFVEQSYPRTRDAVYLLLRRHNIVARRYFYPLISHFPMYRQSASAAPDNLPIAEQAAREVICLPIYPDLDPQVPAYIASVLANPDLDDQASAAIETALPR